MDQRDHVSVLPQAEHVRLCVSPCICQQTSRLTASGPDKGLGIKYWSSHWSELGTGERRGSVRWLLEGPEVWSWLAERWWVWDWTTAKC